MDHGVILGLSPLFGLKGVGIETARFTMVISKDGFDKHSEAEPG